jgi:predicted nucleotidyltransferase
VKLADISAERSADTEEGMAQMTRPKETAQRTVRDMANRLIAAYAPEKVILFGSYAYGEPDRDSDIDLLIIKDTQERFLDRWTTVQGILTGTHRSLPLETLVLTPREIEKRLAAGDQFIREILERGEVLYAAQ